MTFFYFRASSRQVPLLRILLSVLFTVRRLSRLFFICASFGKQDIPLEKAHQLSLTHGARPRFGPD
jgi:hypothetical protein